jgi:rSAM/selenodomain-associated transferase 2
MSESISIIVPTLNEAAILEHSLEPLQRLREQGHEVIIVDGGSGDHTPALASPYADQVISAGRGRALQMNRGARAANGSLLWFLHADTRIPMQAAEEIIKAIGAKGSYRWGRFDVRLSGDHWLLRLIARMMNLRSRLTGIATGDQGIFIQQGLFKSIGGYSEIPLMEDIDLSKRLKSLAAPYCSPECLVTSSRRWEANGIVRTILLMWYLRLGYFFGRSPERLAGIYRELPR